METCWLSREIKERISPSFSFSLLHLLSPVDLVSVFLFVYPYLIFPGKEEEIHPPDHDNDDDNNDGGDDER